RACADLWLCLESAPGAVESIPQAQHQGAVPVAAMHPVCQHMLVDIDMRLSSGNAFVFEPQDSDSLRAALQRGLAARQQEEAWAGLCQRLMQVDHSWHACAQRYQGLHRLLC
ncbi:MAG: hypothetical protein ACPGUV_10920, partial [Polyangiales bacterium]